MKLFKLSIVVIIIMLLLACAEKKQPKTEIIGTEIKWQSGMDVEVFWLSYVESKGGLTWGRSAEYPIYNQVKEGDTFMVEVAQGPCLMEFFHSRWRRANDVRRWDDSINQYGGCPYVFD